MAIQNAINQMLGAAGTAATINQHLKQQAQSNEIAKENQEIEALENKPKAEQELDDLTGQEVELENSINYMTTERDALAHKAEDKRISELTRLMRTADVMAKEKDIEKANLSLNTVVGKQEAIRMRIDRYNKILEGVK
jgi:hypothetical protein